MILAYVLAIIVVAILCNTGMLILFPLRKTLAKSKNLLIVVSTLMTFFSNIFAVYVIIWLCDKLNVQPLFSMLIIPYFIIFVKGFRRIKRAKSGRRMAEISYQETGDIYHGSEKFQTFLIRHEYGHFVGDLLGLTVGAVLFF